MRQAADAAFMHREASDTFPCFGSSCTVHVIGDGDAGTAQDAVGWARLRLELWHRAFTRFEPDSELSRLNADPRHAVPVSREMAAFVQLAIRASRLTGGLVDATLAGEIEAAGYSGDLRTSVPLREALAAAPARRPAGPAAASRGHLVRVDRSDNLVIRPPGVRLDSGGLAKGLFCDLLAAVLDSHDAYAIDCAGDVRIGGRAQIERSIQVAGPFDGAVLHTFAGHATAAATSGIGRRSWVDRSGGPAHHLLDPSSGRPAFTGVVQATALASTAALAEVCAKAAVLSGPDDAPRWLPDGGVVVYDDGSHDVLGPVGRSQEAPSFL